MSDRRAIACNYRESTNVAAAGALAYISNTNFDNAAERVELLVRSRSGHWIQKWQNTRRLTNFRVVTIPPEHPRHDDDRMRFYHDVDEWRIARLYFHDGSAGLRRHGNRGRFGALNAGWELGGHDGGATAVAVTADGRLGLTSAGGEALLWDLRDGRLLRRMGTGIGPVAFAGAGRLALLGCADGDVEVWDLALGGCVREEHCHHSPDAPADWLPAPDVTPVVAIAATSDARRVLTAGAEDPRVGLWDLRDGADLTPPRWDRAARVDAVAISADGRTGLRGGTSIVMRYEEPAAPPRRGTHAEAALIDLDSGEPLVALAEHEREVCAVALSAGAERALTASLDGTVRVWHLRWGEERPREDWDDAAVALIEDFVCAHRPYPEPLAGDGPLRGDPASWGDDDVSALMRELEDAGFAGFDRELVEVKLRLTAGR